MLVDGLREGRNMQDICKSATWLYINLCCVRHNKCNFPKFKLSQKKKNQ